jgi:hypothetical protein
MIVYLSDSPATLSIANTTIDVEDATRFLDRLSSPSQPHTFQTFDDDKDRKNQSLVRILHGTLDDVMTDLTFINAARVASTSASTPPTSMAVVPRT